MKKQKLLVISTSLLACLCVSCASGDSSSSASKTSLKSSETTSSYVESNSESSSISSNDSYFKFSSETTAAAYIEDLMNATKDNNFTLEYNDGESTYQDIITPYYATIRDEYNGYVVLDSYNSNDTFLKDKILYTFINENNKPNLSLPTVNSSSSGTTIARSIDDINYIKKAFSESTPLDANAITIGKDGIVTLKDSSYSYYNAMNDLIQIFHTSSISYWSLDHITLSKTETTFTMDFYYSSSDTPVASATIKNVGTSKSEVVEANMDNFKLPEGNIGYYDLNDIRDNRFTVKSTFSKVSESGSEVIGVVGSNMSLNKYEYITYDTTGENIENISSCINKDGEMCTIQIDGKNEVTYSDSGYTWDRYFYDFSQYLDPQAFRTSTSEEHDYEYFGVHYTSILGGLTYSSTSSYGNLRHLYLDETDGEVSSFTAVFEDVVDTDNVTKHVEIQIEILDDQSFTEVTPFSSSSSDEIFVSAFESSFGGETSYKATIKSTEDSVENVTYVIYFDTTTSSIIREKYTTSDGISSIESVDGYKLMSGTANDGITYFTYDLETKIAKARQAPFDGDLKDMELFTTSPYLFDKQQTGEYTIKASITNVGDTINFAHGSTYTDDTLSFEVSDGKITKASLTIDDWWSTITDSITFEYSGYTLSSDYTTALTSMTEFVTPTNWVDFDSEIGAELIEFLGSEDLAKQVPFIYTSLVDSWRVFESGDYDWSTYEIIAGTEYINIYPGKYESSNSDALLQWLNSYNTLLENDASWTELDSTSKGRVFSNGSIKVTVGTSVLSGLYIQKVSA